MSLINLIKNLDSTEKTDILGEETTRILKFTFSKKDTDAIPSEILDAAVATKEGANLVKKVKYRALLAESIRKDKLAALGFKSYEDALIVYSKDVKKFISDFSIEDKYLLEEPIDERKSAEYSFPIYGENLKAQSFLHPYQLRLKDSIISKLASILNPSILATMPTGAGKTVLAMEVLTDLFRNSSMRSENKLNFQAAWIVDSQELAEQSFQSFQKIWKQKGDRKVMAQRFFTPFDKPLNNSNENKITFATFSLMTARITETYTQQFFSQTDLLIIDEAHGANAYTYEEVIKGFKKFNPNVKIIGLTATPYRNDDNEFQTIKGMFQTHIEIENELNEKEDSPMQYLIDNGYLSKIEFQVLNSEKGGSESDYYHQLHNSVKSECEKLISNNQNTIIFAQSKAHAIALNIYLSSHNIENELIIGETPTVKRKEFLKNFGSKDSSLSVLVNYQILSTGIDVPGMNSIMILSNIDSPTLALQIIGRAMRGEKNGGNVSNTIFLTKDNFNKLKEYKLLENIVLNN
jgi:DNA repair protein RadD